MYFFRYGIFGILSALLLGGVGGLSERTNMIAMINVMASGMSHTIFKVGISSAVLTNNGGIERAMQVPRTIASVIPPLAIADSSLQGNQSLVTCITQ